MENSKEVAAELMKTETANQFKESLIQHGASEESANDLMRHASFEAVEFMDVLKPIVKDNDNQIVAQEKLIEELKQAMPSYFAFGAGSTETNNNLATLSEHHVINILQGIEDGTVTDLSGAEKAALRSGMKSLENKEGGTSVKKLGDYSAMDIHKLCRKVGGLIQ